MAHIFQYDSSEGELNKLASGAYVYLYLEHVNCSSANLAQLEEFMVFEEEEEEEIVPGSSSSVLDLNAFMYDNKALLQMLLDNHELRCLHCTPFMEYAYILLVGAGGVSTVMHVMEMEEATVEGMTLETSVVSIEVGIQTPSTVDVFLKSGKRAPLPKKLGEVLASTYLLASLHNLNKNYFSSNWTNHWIAYAILVVRGSCVLAVRLHLNAKKCQATIILQDCRLSSLKDCLDHAVNQISPPPDHQ